MGRKRDKEIVELLESSARAGELFAAEDRALQTALARRIGRGVVRPWRGLYASSAYWDSLSKWQRAEHLVQGVAKLHPSWLFCGPSAALIYGLPISLWHLDVVHVVSHKSSGGKRVRYHRRLGSHIPSGRYVKGVHVTSFEETVVDCLLTLDFKEGLAIADAALARLCCAREQLLSLVERLGGGRPGIRGALECVRWADARSESGGESMARAVMIRHGFILPELQVTMGDPTRAGQSWRCDYLWRLADGTTVAGELDGLEKYVNPEMTKGRDAVRVMSDERIRESQLTLAVDRVLRFTYSDVAVEARLVRKLERFGIPRVR